MQFVKELMILRREIMNIYEGKPMTERFKRYLEETGETKKSS
jgi:hypothetical protein